MFEFLVMYLPHLKLQAFNVHSALPVPVVSHAQHVPNKMECVVVVV